MLFESFPVGPLECNCSIIGCKETGQAAVIDPGGNPERILEALKRHGLTIKCLLHTHAHFDHVLSSRALKEATGAKIYLHQGDKWLYDNLAKQGMMFGFHIDDPLPVDHYLADEEEVQIGKIKTSVIHTPGHTPGSLSFTMADQDNILFAGDTLFYRSIGRTDLWGGSFEQIIDSITKRLFILDDSTRVIPGHGIETDIWSEKKENPFVS